MEHPTSPATKAAFSLVELLVVTVILVILSAFVLGAVQSAQATAVGADCVSRLKQTGQAFLQYRNDEGGFPALSPPAGLGDLSNWGDLWAMTDPNPAGAFNVNDGNGNGMPDGNETLAPRVPRLLTPYAGDVKVLHCPSNGATAWWLDVGPYYYHAQKPAAWTSACCWQPMCEVTGKLSQVPLAGCQAPPEVAASTTYPTWRHGERVPGTGTGGRTHHLYATQAVRSLIDPKTWNAQ